MSFRGDELGPDARALLDAVRDADGPSPADAARVRRKVATQLALGAAAGATAATVTKTAEAATVAAVPMTSTFGVKAIVAVALLGGASATAVWHDRAPVATVSAAAPTIEARSVARAANSIESDAHRDEASVAEAPARPEAKLAEAPPRAEAKLADAPARPEAKVIAPARTVAPTRSATPRGARAETASIAPAAPPAANAPVAVAPAQGAAPPSAPPPSAPPPSAPPPSAPPLRDTVVEEAALLRAANAALAHGDGTTALARLDEHAKRFPRGALSEEREAARVLALCAAGRASESRAAATKFVSANPRSPFLPQVNRACAAR